MSSRMRRAGLRFLRNKQYSARNLSQCPAFSSRRHLEAVLIGVQPGKQIPQQRSLVTTKPVTIVFRADPDKTIPYPCSSTLFWATILASEVNHAFRKTRSSDRIALGSDHVGGDRPGPPRTADVPHPSSRRERIARLGANPAPEPGTLAGRRQ